MTSANSLSKQLAIAPGDAREFAELHDALHEQLAPEGALELGIFHMIAHATWNLQRFRTLEAQLMANGLDSLLDETTATALDRLQRYTAAAQRSCFKAIHELRTVQNNRIHRRELEGHDDPLPELVNVAEVIKRIERSQNEAADKEYRAATGSSFPEILLRKSKEDIAAKAAAKSRKTA